MEKTSERPSLWLLAIGVMALMASVGLAGYVTYRYLDDVDYDVMMYETWLNGKRELYSRIEDKKAPVDTNGNPKWDDHITRSDGGTLDWGVKLYEVDGYPLSSPALVDFNNNGNREVVISSAGDAIYCLEPNGGGYYWREPWVADSIDYLGETAQTSGLDFKPPPIFSSVMVADLTAGDTPEVVIGVKDGALCLDSDGGKMWKKGLTSGYYFSTACITDLEGAWTGDKEDLEIILASDDENRDGWLEAFEVDGGAIFREECPVLSEGGLIGCSVVAHDLDGDFYDQYKLINPDPSKERDTELIIGNHDRGLRIFQRQGENSEGKPNYDETTSGMIAGHQTYGTTCVANVTGGPEEECFVFSSEGYEREWTGWGGKMYMFTPDAQKIWDYSTGSSRSGIQSSGAIADVHVAKDDLAEKKLDYELAITCDNGNLYMLNTDERSLMWTFNTGGRCMSSPAFLNIDNDDMLEVVVGSDSGKVFCLEGDPTEGIDDGIQYDGDGPGQDVLWVYDTGVPIGVSSPSVADIDMDGQLEVVIGDTQGNVYSINCGGRCVRGQADWPEFHYDLNRTGFYNPQTSYGVDLYPKRDPETGIADPMVKNIDPGQTVTYNITIENTGEGISETNRDTIWVRIDPASVPYGWNAWLDTPSDKGNDDPGYVRLASHETATLVLNVIAPWEGDIGEIARINISANSTFDRWSSDELTTLSVLNTFIDFDMEFLKAIETDPLSPFYNEKVDRIDPGAKQQYVVSVTNKGNVNDTYALSLSAFPLDSGWDWYFIETKTCDIAIDLDSPIFSDHGAVSGTTLVVEVVCPISALKDTRIPITLTGRSVKSLNANIEPRIHIDTLFIWVGEFTEVSLRIEDSTKYVDPNGTVDFTLMIMNNGNKDVIKVRLSPEGVQPGWTVRCPEGDLPVFQGQTDSRTIRITAPGSARAGSKLVLEIEGIVVGTQYRDVAPLTVIVNHVYDLDASVLEKEGVKADPGSSVHFNVQISNLGNGEDTVRPESYEIPLGWNVTFFDREGFQKYEIDLDFEENVFLLGRIKVPQDTRTGQYTIGINISGEGCFSLIWFHVCVNQTYDIRIRTEEGSTDSAVDIQPGQEKPFVVMVTNQGNGLETISIKLGRGYDPVRDINDPLLDEWEGEFVAISNTPDFTTNIKYADLRTPILVTDVGADVYYIPDPQMDQGSINALSVVLDKGQTAYVHMTIKAPSNDIGETVTVAPVQVSATGSGIDDWDVVKYNITVLFPDLAFAGRISVFGTGGGYSAGDVLTISVKVVNVGDIAAENVDVQLLVDGQVKKVQTLRTVKNESDDVKTVIFTWVATAGKHEIKVVLDPEDTVKESADQYIHQGSQNNNEVRKTITIGGNDLVKVLLSDNPIISTLFIILLAIAILAGVALYLKSKRLI
jgi:uncharacterized membrane protein